MSKPRRRKPVILVFGENLNDSQSVSALLIHAQPNLVGRVEARPRPTSLARSAGVHSVRRWTDLIERTIVTTQLGGRSVQAVVVHRDADASDQDGAAHRELAEQLSSLSTRGHPVVPVQELEAWWFLFPDAVEAVRQQWRGKLRRSDRDVEAINNPKEELKRLTRSQGGKEYQEADSPLIARHIREHSPAKHGRSASYDRLTQTARAL